MQAIPFAESLLAWQLVCYGIGADMAHHAPQPAASEPASSATRFRAQIGSRRRWIATMLLAILWVAILVWALGGSRASLALAGTILTGSLLVPAIRRLWVRTRFLAEFEAGTLLAFGLALWRMGGGDSNPASGALSIDSWNGSRQTACCILASLFLFAVRGGSLVVVGILEKSGGIPDQALLPAGATYNHPPGEMIGYIERAIVLTFVAAGNLQALAFFFVAKGLARSRKLDEDPVWANYFLLGSLASFFLALVCGMAGQQTLAAFWK